MTMLSCNAPKERNSPVSGEQIPAITTQGELDTAIVAAGNRMVVLDLYADWCMPCKILEPTLVEISRNFKGKAFFYRINVDRSPELARSFRVRGIPYVVFMKNGKGVYALTGINPKETYEKIIGLCENSGSADECIETLNGKI